MQTPFDDTLFEAVDEQGRSCTCRALVCFEQEDKFFVLYIEEGLEPLPQNLRAGYCELEMLHEGDAIPLFPLENKQQWDWVGEHLKAEIEHFLMELLEMTQKQETSLFSEDGQNMDFAAAVEEFLAAGDDPDALRDLYDPDSEGNYLS